MSICLSGLQAASCGHVLHSLGRASPVAIVKVKTLALENKGPHAILVRSQWWLIHSGLAETNLALGHFSYRCQRHFLLWNGQILRVTVLFTSPISLQLPDRFGVAREVPRLEVGVR